jgi:Flp pilus assembly protein TadD
LRPQVTRAPKAAPVTPAAESARVPVPKVAERVAPQAGLSAKQLYKDGRTLLRQDELGAASVKLAQAAALDPDDAKIWNALGFCHMRQKKYKESLTALNKAIALDPRYQNAYQNRSAVKKLLGDGSGSARDRAKAKLLAKRHRRGD